MLNGFYDQKEWQKTKKGEAREDGMVLLFYSTSFRMPVMTDIYGGILFFNRRNQAVQAGPFDHA